MPTTVTTTITTGTTSFGSGVYITVINAAAVYATLGQVPTLTNYGTLIASGAGSFAVSFRSGGTVVNAGTIGGNGGIHISGGAAHVINVASIVPASYGVRLDSGGFVSNASTGTIGGSGVYILGAGETLVNDGTITGFFAAKFNSAATVTNTGSIMAGARGVVLLASNSTVVNSGLISGTVQSGIQLAGGVITNQSSGTISSKQAIVATSAVTVVNSGTITGGVFTGNYGVHLQHGGSITNNAGGTITARVGIYSEHGATTVTNSGSIGGSANAVLFSAGYANMLNVNPGAVFSGTIDGGYGPGISSSVLNFGSGTGTLNGFGTSVTNFGTIVFASDASWSIAGNAAGLSRSIHGFHEGDQIDVQGIGIAKSATVSGNALRLFSGPSGTGTLLFTFPSITNTSGVALDPTKLHLVSDGQPGGTVVACFRRGTRIRTPRGETPVEDLLIGDPVLTAAGVAVPVRWIGRRSYSAAQIALDPAALAPIRFQRGALGENMPQRDLDVSPEHALLLDNVLVPARHLVNGVTIRRCEVYEAVDYLHIELAGHDIVLANRVPAETFVDCDSRSAFDNAEEFTLLYGVDANRWRFCAPRVADGEILADIRQRLAGLAGLAVDDWRHPAAEGRLIGNLEAVSPDEVRGWAQDQSDPERPVQLHILAEGMVIGTAIANRHRRDLEDADLGSGRHAFRVKLPKLAGRMTGRIEVRRATDRSPLPGSPMPLEPASL